VKYLTVPRNAAVNPASTVAGHDLDHVAADFFQYDSLPRHAARTPSASSPARVRVESLAGKSKPPPLCLGIDPRIAIVSHRRPLRGAGDTEANPLPRRADIAQLHSCAEILDLAGPGAPMKASESAGSVRNAAIRAALG